MKVSLLYIDDCPNWQVASARLDEALQLSGHAGVRVDRVLVTSDEQASALHFVGSPTILVDGEDPFLDDESRPVGLSCRVYRTADGASVSPSLNDLVAAILARA